MASNQTEDHEEDPPEEGDAQERSLYCGPWGDLSESITAEQELTGEHSRKRSWSMAYPPMFTLYLDRVPECVSEQRDTGQNDEELEQGNPSSEALQTWRTHRWSD